jgi:hypothetical protein
MSDDERDPFEELADDADDDRDPFAELDEADPDEPDPDAEFESVDVAEVDVEEVWASLDGEEPAPEAPEVSLGSNAEAVEGGDEHRVPKAEYCERCPHFADPPEVACGHDGSTIVAVEDADHFRVRGCPMVEHGPPTDDR